MRKKLTTLAVAFALLFSAQALALNNWDIDSDTTVTSGIYDFVRIDYNNPGGSSEITMEGGSIASLGTYHSSSFLVSGGTVGNLNSFDESTFVFVDGLLGNIWGFDESHIIIHGSSFNLGFGDIQATSGRLIGTSLAGASLFVNFERHDNSRITLVPEPVTLFLFMASGVLVARKYPLRIS